MDTRTEQTERTEQSEWKALVYPDSDAVGLLYRFAQPSGLRQVAIDAGCGTGRHLPVLQQLGYQTVGMEQDEALCQAARSRSMCSFATCVDLNNVKMSDPPELVLAWGLFMVDPALAEVVAGWRPGMIIANWRKRGANSFEDDTINTTIELPGVYEYKLAASGRTIYSHDESGCGFASGYQCFYWQTTSRTDQMGQVNTWHQTVHKRIEV